MPDAALWCQNKETNWAVSVILADEREHPEISKCFPVRQIIVDSCIIDAVWTVSCPRCSPVSTHEEYLPRAAPISSSTTERQHCLNMNMKPCDGFKSLWETVAVSQFRSASFRGAFEGQLHHNAVWSLSKSEGSSRFWRMHRYDPSWPHTSQDSLRVRKRRKKERKWRHWVA